MFANSENMMDTVLPVLIDGNALQLAVADNVVWLLIFMATVWALGSALAYGRGRPALTDTGIAPGIEPLAPTPQPELNDLQELGIGPPPPGLSSAESIERLASEMTHGLKQPLTALVNYTSAATRFLDRGEAGEEAARDAMQRAIDEAMRAGDLLDSARQFVSSRPLDVRSVNLNDIAHEAIDSLDGGASIALHLAPTLPPAGGDALLLEQAMVHLLTNALEAVDGQGHRIVVRTRVGRDRHLELSVSDSGAGLAADIVDRLFDPFVTSKPYSLGFGLAISKRIIERHGGAIEARDNPEGGATFRFTVPRAEACLMI